MPEQKQRTRLCQLATERHWQVYETFEARFRRAAIKVAEAEMDERYKNVSVSRRQLERWYRGSLKNYPRPMQSRVLEELFEHPVSKLMEIVTQDSESNWINHSPTSSHSVEPIVVNVNPLSNAASKARLFTSQHEQLLDGSETMQQLFDDVRTLARVYPNQPASALLNELARTQDLLFKLLEARLRPSVAKDVYFHAAILTGMLAKASHDLGDTRSAMAQTRAAMVCANNSEHDGLQAWLYGMKSLISFWAGDPSGAVSYAQQGASRLKGQGSVAAWLPSLEARAHATLGDQEATEHAIRKAEAARDSVVVDDLDSLGGILLFPRPKQLYYAAEADVLVKGKFVLANRAEEAVDAYRSAGAGEWAFSDDAGARSALALVHVRRGDAEAAQAVLQPVLELDVSNRINGIVRSLERVQRELSNERFGNSTEVIDLRDKIDRFIPGAPRAVISSRGKS